MKDVLLITWHGIHELEVTPGLPDTGGQNVYVQNMAERIHDVYKCRVIVLNRGGYLHPYTKRMREKYTKDPEREVYVLHARDEIDGFVRKEYLTGALVENAARNVPNELPPGYSPDIIISHFWDGGLMGTYLRKHFPKALHFWIPHEPVGMKKAPMAEEDYDAHGIVLREHYESRIVHDADFIGSTSKLVERDLKVGYGGRFNDKVIDVFPGVSTERFRPNGCREISKKRIREYSELLGIPEERFRRPHICEFGRSDALKDKDKAVEAFALVARRNREVDMFLNLDEDMEPAIGRKIRRIIGENGLEDRVHVLSPKQLPQSGEGHTILPDLLKSSKAFLTMSVMEGFGMAACEAAASGVPVVGTDQIPVLTDVIAPAGGGRVVPGKDVNAAARAVLEILDMDDATYRKTARQAYRSVIPKYTWDAIIKDMFAAVQDKAGSPRRAGAGPRA